MITVRLSEVPEERAQRKTLADLTSSTGLMLSLHVCEKNYMFLVGINVSFL